MDIHQVVSNQLHTDKIKQFKFNAKRSLIGQRKVSAKVSVNAKTESKDCAFNYVQISGF